MEFLASLLVAGISMGAVYALIALGLNLTFWTTRTLNFGQGSLMMLCAMITAVLTAPGGNPVLPILAGLAVVGAVAVLTERYAVRTKDSQAPTRTHFHGLHWYAPDPRYIVTATWTPSSRG